jgi:hypothetical protein
VRHLRQQLDVHSTRVMRQVVEYRVCKEWQVHVLHTSPPCEA